MLTNSAITTTPARCKAGSLSAGNATQTVVIVNGSTEMLELLETVLDAGHYDVVFVESSDHAYSQIKRVQPNLVILCVRIDEMDGLHVLSMLKLDGETKDIPVLTYTTEYDGQERDEEVAEPSDVEILTPKPAMQMN
jgi:CheY-like chemotaxis protein